MQNEKFFHSALCRVSSYPAVVLLCFWGNVINKSKFTFFNSICVRGRIPRVVSGDKFYASSSVFFCLPPFPPDMSWWETEERKSIIININISAHWNLFSSWCHFAFLSCETPPSHAQHLRCLLCQVQIEVYWLIKGRRILLEIYLTPQNCRWIETK